MIAGFLTEAGKLPTTPRLTCCTPFNRTALTARFPEIEWLAYDETSRISAIRSCDAWLGLGGSPFQHRVSRWFIDHLLEERNWCSRWDRPMHFLGIGAQEISAFEDRELCSVFESARNVWMRDAWSLPELRRIMTSGKIRPGADLAHLFLQSRHLVATPERIVATLNFDYQDWNDLPNALKAMRDMVSSDRVWFSQESRALGGSEQSIWHKLPQSESKSWTLQVADNEASSATAIIRNWPTGEWLVTSRFHTSLVGMWAGSKIIVVATNGKLRGLANDFDLPCVEPNASLKEWHDAISSARPVQPARLAAAASDAERACREFFESIW